MTHRSIATRQPLVSTASPLASFALQPQDRDPRLSWGAIVSGALSFALIVVIVHQFAGFRFAELHKLLPASPLFWMMFVVFYLVSPVSEWVIFRRLWAIPASGLAALLRKKVYNELLLGYLGEAYFYGWARQRVEMTSAPFGAVKDVAILSAMAGNLVTLGLLIAMWPFIHMTALGIDSRLLFLSLGVILLISLAATVLRERVFSLPRHDLVFIMWQHVLRIALTIGFWALLWHLALPVVALSWWLYLATLRMLVSRLPLVPNKDLIFAGVAVFTLGREADIASLMALMAGIIVIAHVVVGIAIALADLALPAVVRTGARRG